MRPTPLHFLSRLLGCTLSCHENIHGVSIDSRLIKRGDLFFALPGKRVDGHHFLKEAAAKGAVGAVVSQEYKGESFGLTLLGVENVLASLQELARRILENRRSQVIGITGSVGKTTTKVFLAQLLAPHFKISASPMSYNSQATFPLSIIEADESVDYLILEMGMSEPGQIKRLISIAPPTFALLTNVSIQHADDFPDGLDGIAREKGSLFSHPKTQLGFLPLEVYGFEPISRIGTCPKKVFSCLSNKADFSLSKQNGKLYVSEEGGEPMPLHAQFSLKAYYQNLLGALAVARSLGVPWDSLLKTCAEITPPSMRFEPVEKEGILFINDAFNANPDSMKAALESLPKPQLGGRRIAVLGEMNALGIYTESGHLAVAECALEHVDLLICVGNYAQMMHEVWKARGRDSLFFETRSQAGEALLTLAKKGDVVLLKGARAHSLDLLLNLY